MKKYMTMWPALLAVMILGANAFGAVDLHPDPGHKLKVFILAGQSNMDGRGDGSKLTDQDRQRLAKAQGNVLFAYNRQPIVPLDVTTPSAGTKAKFKLDRTFGPELFFGMGVAEAWPGEKILLIKHSIGGTSLYGCWNPDWTQEKAAAIKEQKSPKLYSDTVTYIKEVLGDLKPDEYEFCGMLWVQGEADSGGKGPPEASKEYGKNLRNLVDRIRADVKSPALPFLIMEVGSGDVVKGMQQVAKEAKNVSFLSQSKDEKSPDYLPGYGPPTGHYNYEGMKRIGTRFAERFVATDAKGQPSGGK